MKKQQTKTAGLLQQALRNDPHGDTVALQMNPQEAQIVGGLLKQMGGAGVGNPRTGMLQFYPAGAMGGGSNPGGDRNGYAGRSGDGSGTGNGGDPGRNGGISINRVGQNLTADQVRNSTPVVGQHETLGYYGDRPTDTQQALSRIGNFFGIGYHPNAINFNGSAYNSYSADPLKIGLGLAGFASPFGTAASLAYRGLNAMGVYGPQLSWSGVPGSGNAAQTASAAAGPGSNADPQQAANVTNQQQAAALQAATGASVNPASVGLLSQYQAPQQSTVWDNYGTQSPGYGYLAWR